MPKVSRTINKVDPYQAITPRRALRESGVKLLQFDRRHAKALAQLK